MIFNLQNYVSNLVNRIPSQTARREIPNNTKELLIASFGVNVTIPDRSYSNDRKVKAF